MAEPSSRPLFLQPRPKSIATSGNSSVTASATSISPRPSSRSRQSSPVRATPNADASDKAAIALVRRVLCPPAHAGYVDQRPIEELLPPLTSSNDVDLQLYALIAIFVKDLVQVWYGKITPDQAFVEELVRVIAHCTRALEQRLRNVDLEALVFDEIPGLIESHVLAHRISHQTMEPWLSTNPHTIYHQLNPHPAMSPVPDPSQALTVKEQEDNEAAYRQLLVQGALAVLLPTDELKSACVRTIVADVIAEKILGSIVGGKASEGRFIWNGIIKTVEMINARQGAEATGEDPEAERKSQLEKFGLLSEGGQSRTGDGPSHRSMSSKVFWQILRYGYLMFSALRFMIFGLIAASSRPPRASSAPVAVKGLDSPPITKTMQPRNISRPVLKFKIFPLISVLLNLPLRMPWLSGCASLFQHQLIHGSLKVGATDGLIDQFIHHLLQEHLSPSTLLPQLLLALRTNLFPHSSLRGPSPASPVPAPPPADDHEIKTACARALRSLIPTPILARFFASDAPADWDRAIEAELDVWGDSYLNRHLAYAVVELVVVRVMPELHEKGVQEMMERRGVEMEMEMGAE